MEQLPIPATMIEAVRQFSDRQVAHDFFVQIRFPNGVACPREGCGDMDVAFMPKYLRWYCKGCKRQFSAKVGTIFEDSPIGMDKWLPAVWLIASNKNGISSHELGRALHVTQRTAWFMLHRIREAMADEHYTKLMGPVEADEAYFGGPKRRGNIGNRNLETKSEGPQAGKTAVFGMVQRRESGKVRAFVVPSTQKATLHKKIRENVLKGAVLYTDAWTGYSDLRKRYVHYVINHSIEYVNGHIHTNSIESFWALLKRMIKGTQVHVSPEHLQRYVEEQVFRFNERKTKDGERFAKAVKMTDGARLTYRELTASSS
jgi:transposase-like protein